MTIHAKNCKPGCISFFMEFSSESCWGPPPRDAPGAKSYIYNWGSNMAKMIEGHLRIPKMYDFMFTFIFNFRPKVDGVILPSPLNKFKYGLSQTNLCHFIW